MRLANESAAIVSRVLNKCCEDLTPDGAWRWRGAVQNGTRLPIAASLEEGFLHFACRPGGIRKCACSLEHALLGNTTLAGGVKLALGKASTELQLTTDIVILEEKQLLDRFQWALCGFHHGLRLLKSPASHFDQAIAQTIESGADLRELLREIAWPMTERGPNDFSAALDANSAPPARIRMSDCGVLLSVELARSDTTSKTSRLALALFLLTATSALRLVRAYAEEMDGRFAFGVQVNLPAAPDVEEIDHALAALSIALRMCARETNVLLNEATARSYLAARDLSTSNYQPSEKEN
ncbi:MAG: hypothetical protein ABR976_14985 [Terracidiphilus sp.]|jgi:hypothetical protein